MAQYGAVGKDDNDDLSAFYEPTQPRVHKTKSKFARQSSYSSNAASVDNYMELELESEQQIEDRVFSNEFQESPRVEYKQNNAQLGSKPSDHLNCLWFSIILLLICALAGASCIEQNILQLRTHSSDVGTYYWSLGWNGDTFGFTSGSIEDVLNADVLPLTFTKRYARDAGRLLVVSCLIVVILVICALFLLCARCNNEHYLYIKCCGIRIPQSPSLYIIFSTIKHYSRINTYFYLAVIIYGTLELNLYISYRCPPGTTCQNYPIPHYGLVSMFIIGFVINCWIHKRIIRLDKAFNKNTIQFYYPQHIQKLNSKDCMINLYYCKATLHNIRIILICTSIMFLGFNNSCLILIGIFDNGNSSDSLTQPVSAFYFQSQGLLNDESGYNDISSANNFVLLCYYIESVILPVILLFNFILLLYFYRVIVKFKSIGCCKFMFIFMMFIQWLTFTIMFALYYYMFQLFWKDYLEENREHSAVYNENNLYDTFWCPDWGLLVVLVVDFFMLKLIVFAFKAI